MSSVSNIMSLYQIEDEEGAVDLEDATTNNNTSFLILPENSDTTLGIPQKLISDELLYWTEILGYVGGCGVISLLGIIANIINIIVFARQGVLSDSNTVSLFALSVSDLFGLITLLWVTVCYILFYTPTPNLPFNPLRVLVITGGRPHVMCVQTSGWITVYIAFERCMCVVFPFKVGRMFDAKRTAILIPTIVLIIIICGYLPYYTVEYLVWREDTSLGFNRSVIVVYRGEGYASVMSVYGVLNALVSKPAALALVLCFSQITIVKVNASRKWKQSTTRQQSEDSSTTGIKQDKHSNTNNTDKKKDPVKRGQNTRIEKHAECHNNNETFNSDKKKKEGKGGSRSKSVEIGAKEKRLVKMMWAICGIFVACMTPNLACIIVRRIIPDIGPGMRYSNLFFFIYAFSFFLEGLNATVNILVYHRMSTRYRNEFGRLFRLSPTQ